MCVRWKVEILIIWICLVEKCGGGGHRHSFGTYFQIWKTNFHASAASPCVEDEHELNEYRRGLLQVSNKQVRFVLTASTLKGNARNYTTSTATTMPVSFVFVILRI